MNRDQKLMFESYVKSLLREQAAPPAPAPAPAPAVPPEVGVAPETSAEAEDPIKAMVASITPDQLPDLLIALGEMIKAQTSAEAGVPPEGATLGAEALPPAMPS